MAELDIKEMIEDLVEKILADENLKKKFMKEPIAVVEKLIGIDLPDDKIEKLVAGIRAKVAVDDISGALGGLGSLFGKKK